MAEQIERLAHHALRGEVWDKALAYCRQAGEKAMAQSAYREAVGSFEQALSALTHLPETRDIREQAVDLRLALRHGLTLSGSQGRILVYLHEAEPLAEALDDPRRLGQVSLFLSIAFANSGAHDQAIAAAQRALTLATAGGEAVLHALATLYLGIAYYAQGDYRRAIDCFRQAVAFFEGARRYERFGLLPFLPAVTSRTWLAMCHAELGAFAEGIACGDEGLRIAEEVAHPGSIMWASLWGGMLNLRQGNGPRAISLLERAMGICQDVDLLGYFTRMAELLSAAYTLAGRLADAVSLLPPTLEQAIATDTGLFQRFCLLPLGEAHMLAGRLEEAHAFAERVLTLARECQALGDQAHALHLLGDLAVRHDPPEAEQAEAYYQQALALAEELGMRPLQAHCRRSLGTLYATTGQQEQARVELATAIDLYRAMDMTFWLPQTEAALAQMEGR